jgi:hypothetical protein
MYACGGGRSVRARDCSSLLSQYSACGMHTILFDGKKSHVTYVDNRRHYLPKLKESEIVYKALCDYWEKVVNLYQRFFPDDNGGGEKWETLLRG